MKKWVLRGAMSLALAAGAAGILQTATPRPATAATTMMSASVPTTAAKTAPAPDAPPSYELPLKPQYQQTDYYCMPASAAMSLSTFGIKARQGTLAGKMATTRVGTTGDDALPVLRSYVTSLGYTYTAVSGVTGRPRLLLKRVAYDVGVLHRAPDIGVWMEKLPWNRGEELGTGVGHIMVVYGYDQTKGTITVFDPWKPTGGRHIVSAKTLAGTLQQSGSIHYISRIPASSP